MLNWLLDDVLGIDPSTTTSTQTQSGSNTYDSWVTDASRQIAGRAAEARQWSPFKGTLSSGLTDTHGALSRSAMSNLNTPVSQIGGNMYDPAMAQSFIDKYMNASSGILADNETMRNQRLNAVNSAAGSAFGGSRSTIAAGMENRNADRIRSNIMLNAVNQGINTGFNAHQSHIGNMQNAYNIKNSMIGAGLGVAGAEHGIRQGDLDRARSEHYYNQTAPLQQELLKSQILSQVPKNRYTTGTATGSEQTTPDWASLLVQGASMIGAGAVGG